MAPHRILFVCTGNICRSPMALYLAREMAAMRGLHVELDSAGTMDLAGRPSPPNALAVMRERGIIMDDHRAKGLLPTHVAWADHVLVMTYEHAMTVRDRFPEVGEKLELLGPYGGASPEVADPMGGWKSRFRRARDEIDRAVSVFLDRLPER